MNLEHGPKSPDSRAGEISPDEFSHFIGEDIRLDPVVIGKEQSLQEMLGFFMGKNTPNRQKFIIENLRVEKDEVRKHERARRHYDDERDERDDEFSGEDQGSEAERWSTSFPFEGCTTTTSWTTPVTSSNGPSRTNTTD